MSKSKKLTIIKKNEGCTSPLNRSLSTFQIVHKQSVSLNFRFLHGMSGYDFVNVSKLEKKKHTNLFHVLQKFMFEFCSESDINEAIRTYTSKKGSKISAQQNEHVANIIRQFQLAHPQYIGLIPDNTLLHIHTRRNGKDCFVLFGATVDDTFYVLALDPEHNY